MAENKNITLNVEGMTCANCALGIKKQLEKKGIENVDVNFSTGEVNFIENQEININEISQSINKLGFQVIDINLPNKNKQLYKSIYFKFYFTLIFTIPLFLHMFTPKDFILNNPIVQLVLCIPVYTIGFLHFGKSAFSSLKNGVPNMDVLIFIGSTSAFIYSIIGTIQHYGTPQAHQYLFYETTATIITLVLLGNLLEKKSVKQTTTAIEELSQLQKVKAKKITHNKEYIEVNTEELVVGDSVIINSGDSVPADGEITWGEATLNESMLTGESLPIEKSIANKVVGGTIVEDGSIIVKIEKTGKNTVLSKIIDLIKNAQQNQPKIQQLGDKVSAIFVPIVTSIALLTFCIAYFVFNISFQQSMMQSIAVLVISCPCAMGLATPTAVMVGIGRAAKNGILIKGGSTLEQFAKVTRIVFDKTGTITTGNFKIKNIKPYQKNDEINLKDLLYSIELHSSHPIAKSIVKELENNATAINFTTVEEKKGMGIKAIVNGTEYMLGSSKILNKTPQYSHNLYLTKNNMLIAGIDIKDEIKNNVKEIIKSFNKHNIKTTLLSGDSEHNCKEVVDNVNIKEYYSETLPDEKLKKIEEFSTKEFTAMIGDGINDAPALTKATVGISLSNATQVAVKSAQIVLLSNKDLNQLYQAYLISKHTLKTIKQNLFWAFFYNVIAIPIAAFGFLNPMVAALTMAFSDVIVIGNSIRLKYKKLT